MKNKKTAKHTCVVQIGVSVCAMITRDTGNLRDFDSTVGCSAFHASRMTICTGLEVTITKEFTSNFAMMVTNMYRKTMHLINVPVEFWFEVFIAYFTIAIVNDDKINNKQTKNPLRLK